MIQRGVNVIDNVVTIEVLKTRVRELDELIKQLDVEKKRILRPRNLHRPGLPENPR